MRIFLTIIAGIFLFQGNEILAKENDSIPAYQVGIKTGIGFILTHSPRMSFITNQHVGKRELYVQRNTSGEHKWHQRFGFPRMGISFTYFSLNNPKHLGDAYTLTPYLNFNLLSKRTFNLRFRTALGVGFLEKPFDIETNHKNTAIGSKFNLSFSFSLESEVALTKRLVLSFGTSFSHFSNTSIQKPNLGINIPTIESGLIYRFGKKVKLNYVEESEFVRTNGKWIISGGFGVNQTVRTSERKYTASALMLSREKQLNHKSSIGGSIDAFYNPGRIKSALQDSVFIDKGFDNGQLGISVYHALHIGALNVIAQMGYYLKSEDKGLGNIYHMAGGRIRFKDKWNVFFALKTHFARAEYLLFGLSYQLSHEK